MFTKAITPIFGGVLFALIFTVTPALASATETTNDETTQTTVVTKAKLSFEELLAKARVQLAAWKKGVTNVKKVADGSLGTALKNASSSCIMELVDDREVAIQEAWATFNTSISEALKTRQTALYTAWGNEDIDERVAGIKEAMKIWVSAHKTAFKTLKYARKAAWKTYKETARSECEVSVPAEDKLSSDTSGSVAL